MVKLFNTKILFKTTAILSPAKIAICKQNAYFTVLPEAGTNNLLFPIPFWTELYGSPYAFIKVTLATHFSLETHFNNNFQNETNKTPHKKHTHKQTNKQTHTHTPLHCIEMTPS